MSNDCYLCCGKGGWTNEREKKSELCPICRPLERELASRQAAPVAKGHSLDYRFMPAYHTGPLFQFPPWLLVVHSGAVAPGVAEYFLSPPDGRKVSCHIAWSSEIGGFVQCVPFNSVAWHVGGSSFDGNTRLNFCSIGIELPGPYDSDRNETEKALFRGAVGIILKHVPTLTTCVRHKDIDNNKKDPGGGFKWDWMDGFKLDLPFKS